MHNDFFSIINKPWLLLDSEELKIYSIYIFILGFVGGIILSILISVITSTNIFFTVFSFIVIITFGILYAIFGIKIDDSIISISQSNIFYCLKEGIILSISLFSGSGATESIPANISEIFSVFEIIISVIMIGIGTGVIVRKLVR